ncbi:MAG: hypothetical protein ACI9XK_002567 [Granulosicoccus sp.]
MLRSSTILLAVAREVLLPHHYPDFTLEGNEFYVMAHSAEDVLSLLNPQDLLPLYSHPSGPRMRFSRFEYR